MSKSNFYMAFYEGGYDSTTYIFIVHDRSEIRVVEHYYSHHKEEYEKFKSTAIEKYQIPPEQILDFSEG